MNEILTMVLPGAVMGIAVIGFTYAYFRSLRDHFDRRFEKLDEILDKHETRWVQTNMNLDSLYQLILKKMEK